MQADKKMAWTERAAERALARYEGLVRRQARHLLAGSAYASYLDEEDVQAEGRIAVLEALDTYEGYGTTELTWVRTRVRQRMIDAMRRGALRTRGDVRIMKRAELDPAGADARARAIAARSLCSLDQIAHSERLLYHQGLGTARYRPADEVAIDAQRGRRLVRALETLPDRQRTAMTMTLLEGMGPTQVSRRMGVSPSRVTQLQQAGVAQVRQVMANPRRWSNAPPGLQMDGDEPR